MTKANTVYGKVDPSIKGRWFATEEDETVSDLEYQFATEALSKHLAGKYKVPPPSNGYQCYLRGDNHGDRTQYCEIEDSAIFSEEMVSYLQQWLINNPKWRVATPCHLGDASVVMVYSDSARYIGDEKIGWHAFVADVKKRLIQYEANTN